MPEGEMVGWCHGLYGYELEHSPGAGDRQGSLACCSPWGCRVGHDQMDKKYWSGAFLSIL